ncbi:MarR family winged helix-turn-helix transcriptional regulator [Ructibacterium gallinarum]|uniref:MarR family transcriptional regulator n=1 Tax=Ructibacterium gallinarum TaxID=2779355 RepID=A0A9D5R7Q4_9FIRM|nr:MarR family transcriptional regulator [Ructibacterium gallinarum]MBE5039476.1 MarR family transcriptional regulator [Ructibacterium gallinarum]
MESLMKYINAISRCIVFYRGSKLADSGLRGGQHPYIFQICRNPGVSQEQIAKNLMVHKSSVTRQLSALEQQGFIRRESSQEDRRVMKIYPTEKACAVFPQVRMLSKEWNEAILEDFTEEEQEILLSLMKRVMQKARALTEAEVQEN